MSRFLALLFLLLASAASAQQDTSPPQLVSFSMLPGIVDSSQSDSVLDWSLTATDDLSGLSGGFLIILLRVSPPGTGILPVFTSGGAFSPEGLLEATVSGQLVIPRYAPWGEYIISINAIRDQIGNELKASHPDNYQPGTFPSGLGEANLCSFGPCMVQVVPEPSTALMISLGMSVLGMRRRP